MKLADFRTDRNGNPYGLKKCKYHCDYGDGEHCHYKEIDGCIYNKTKEETDGQIIGAYCNMMACSRCGKLIPGQFTQTEEVLCRECADWLSAPLYGSISFTLKEPLTDEQIDALFPLDQLGNDPRWVEAINKMKETNRRARGDA